MRVFTGKVVSRKTEKTAVVEVTRHFAHPLYEKTVKRSKKYHVHDELGVNAGDVVSFVETRPISKTKKWKIIEVISGKKGKPEAKKKRGGKK